MPGEGVAQVVQAIAHGGAFVALPAAAGADDDSATAAVPMRLVAGGARVAPARVALVAEPGGHLGDGAALPVDPPAHERALLICA